MLIEIALQWTFNFVEQLNNEIHENWYSTNIDETTVGLKIVIVQIQGLWMHIHIQIKYNHRVLWLHVYNSSTNTESSDCMCTDQVQTQSPRTACVQIKYKHWVLGLHVYWSPQINCSIRTTLCTSIFLVHVHLQFYFPEPSSNPCHTGAAFSRRSRCVLK